MFLHKCQQLFFLEQTKASNDASGKFHALLPCTHDHIIARILSRGSLTSAMAAHGAQGIFLLGMVAKSGTLFLLLLCIQPSLAQLDPSAYDGCGTAKGCVGEAEGCVGAMDCEFLLSYAAEPGAAAYRFELTAALLDSDDEYAAAGLSFDGGEGGSMGEDSVVACYPGDDDADFVHVYWNEVGNSVPLDEERRGLSDTAGVLDGGVISCSFVRDTVTTFEVCDGEVSYLKNVGSSRKAQTNPFEKFHRIGSIFFFLGNKICGIRIVGVCFSTGKAFLSHNADFPTQFFSRIRTIPASPTSSTWTPPRTLSTSLAGPSTAGSLPTIARGYPEKTLSTLATSAATLTTFRPTPSTQGATTAAGAATGGGRTGPNVWGTGAATLLSLTGKGAIAAKATAVAGPKAK